MAEGVCIVCGSVRTVKTHLFPRALMLDMRGDAKTLYAGSRHRDGRVERQNGQWDSRFLCAEHEAMFGPGDDYGVKICRSIASLPIAEGAKAVTVDNPRPDLLARFVYACVWRHAMAPLNAPLRLRLGPYEQKLRSALFEDGPLDLQIVPGVSGLTGANGPVNCAVEPYR